MDAYKASLSEAELEALSLLPETEGLPAPPGRYQELDLQDHGAEAAMADSVRRLCVRQLRDARMRGEAHAGSGAAADA